MSPSDRARDLGRVSRWEFLPSWAFYVPVTAWVALLSIRYGGLRVLAAANPGLPDGGLVGESKTEILRLLPPEWTIPFAFIPAASATSRAERVMSTMRRRQWQFPVILKPDVGQRGQGVRRVISVREVAEYVAEYAEPLVMQPWHPGPFEAGIFYWRMPDARRGRIFSITDKVFPFVVGDGRSTLEQLVTSHRRFRRQAALFLRRHAPLRNVVVPAGTGVRLGEVGNHAQGTMFRDGQHLITDRLESRIDAIAQTIPGFFVGRFDVRYSDVQAFTSGQDLAIVELNGVTAESTNIYDPDRSLLQAYRTLFQQWRLIFRIGAANRARGVRASSAARVLRLALSHLRDRRAFPVSS